MFIDSFIHRRRLLAALLLLCCARASLANVCAPATSAGAAASDWATFCWLDFTGYNDTTARSGTGQNFSFTLADGSTLSLNVRATSSAATALTATASPSWSGAAVGNSSFIGIPGLPILYTSNNGSTVTVTLRNITVTPPTGVTASAGWAIVAADAESTNDPEKLVFTTNGASWVKLQNVPPTSGSTYPTLTGTGTATVTETGVAGTVGSYIFSSSNSPTQVSGTLTASGLQGVMFAVRYAWVSINKTLTSTRLNPNDQFKYTVSATANGTQLVSGTSTGSGTGPFTAAQVTVSSGYPVTITEAMATGSVSALSTYTPSLSCTNSNAGSATVMPSNQAVTTYNLGMLAYGDGVTCMFTNTPKRPSLAVVKTSAVVSDPVNGGTNPKRIPGSVVRYVVNITNSGSGAVDASTLVITDPVPANTVLCVATTCSNPVVQFVDGTTPSGLTFNAATSVSYSNTAGGGAPFTYTPSPDAQGFDAAVTGIRISLSGTFAAAGSGNPSFAVNFRVRIN
ncbi:MAG TPA: CshA/CshB family fibrillar adhesin-related protein [Steroidobacteraceae bacterium]|nr:CshA/CshB family fibrillar adhesin-related protein [Steroidobacteraceae bacterium]